MIYYFSGTGNSRFVAFRLGDLLGMDVSLLTDSEMIGGPIDFSEKDETLGLVFPVYSWGISPIILKFVDTLGLIIREKRRANQPEPKIWAVMTCGDETAMAPEMLMKRAVRNELEIKGIWSVIMPNNYVILPGFGIDSKELEQKKLREAIPRIENIATQIKEGKSTVDVTRGSWPKLKTGLIYPLFKHWGIFPQKWRSSEKCVGCGKCEAVCPIANIEMKGGRPNWGENCVSCLGCYHICPTNAIEYGKLTQGKGQYFCPLKK